MSKAKRVSLIAGMKAAKDQVEHTPSDAMPEAAADTQAPAPTRPQAKGGDWMTTAVHIRKDQWQLLREVAFKRANTVGGRQSVSDIIRDLIDQATTTLKSEL